MSRTAAFVLLLCVAASSCAHASFPAPPRPRPLDLLDLAAPAFTGFSARDGLPDAVIVAAVTDREGFVWVGSPAGVARYDGRRWVPCTDAAMRHPVDDLHVSDDGTLWVGFRSHGIARFDGRTWTTDTVATGLPSQQIRRFFEGEDDAGRATLWALTWDRGLMRREGTRWVPDAGNASLPDEPVLSMAQTLTLGGTPRQWIGTGDAGLWYRDAGTTAWSPWRVDGGAPGQVEYLLATRFRGREELWMSVFGVGLARLDATGLRRWSRESGDLPGNDLYDMAATALPDGDRALWVSSRAGLLRVHDDHVQAFDRRHGLPSDVVRGLHAWRSPNGDDVLWLATEGGVSRTTLGASPWLTASLLGARSTGVFAVMVEPDGRGGERLWVGASAEGLALYERGRWRTFTPGNSALPAGGVSMIASAVDGDGRPQRWIGQWGGALLRVDDGPVFRPVATPWPRAAGEAILDTLARRVDGVDEQWFATRRSGVHRLRDGRWTSFRADGVTGTWRVGSLARQRERSGREWLWAGTNQGLARFDGERWTLFARDISLSDPELLGVTLYDDAEGRPVLWLGSSNTGVVRVDVSDPARPRVLAATLPASPDPTVYGVKRDSAGRMYVCTNNGVQRLDPDGDGWRSTVFTRRDGMVHDECNTNAQTVDAHDRFWTGTLGGLTVYDPTRELRDVHPKTLRIVGRRIDGTPARGETLEVRAGAKAFDVDYALLAWHREGESRFRTQLLGYEPAPGPWTAQASRSFTGLPPGTYRLRIEARDHAGNASVPVELPITVAAEWWQTRWALVAGIVALVLLGYGVALLRLRTLRARGRRLEQRVAERTAELHDANARLLALSYVDALTGLANRRRLLETLDHLPRPDGATAALVFVDVDHFKGYNDRHGHPAGDEALRRVADALRACAPEDALVARYGGEEFACLMPGADLATAIAVAECIRTTTAATALRVPGTDEVMRVTLSAGVASVVLVTPDDTHRLMRDADRALYRAKGDGRDQVRAWDGSGD